MGRYVACLLVLIALVTRAAAGSRRVSVVVMRDAGEVRIHIAYPRATSAEAIGKDLAEMSRWGQWRLAEPTVAEEVASVIATTRLLELPADTQLTIWPIVAALKRFDEIVIAYVGPASPSRGSMENDFVSVRWQGSTSGITYWVRMLNRRFRHLGELSVPLPASMRKQSGGPPWGAVAGVLVLAILAGIVTYCMARRFISTR